MSCLIQPNAADEIYMLVEIAWDVSLSVLSSAHILASNGIADKA